MSLQRQQLEEEYEELMFADGFDDCIVGVVTRFGQEPIVCYDYERVIEKLMEDMPRDEAIEMFEYNIIGAYVGELTPCFLEKV